MLDTHAIARSLTDADLTPAQADAITAAVFIANTQGDHVTSDQFKTGLAELRTEVGDVDKRLSTQISDIDKRLSTQIANVRTEISNFEARLIKWIVGTVIATAALSSGILLGILRLIG